MRTKIYFALAFLFALLQTIEGHSQACTPGAATTFTNNTPVAIVDNSTVTSTITVAGAPIYLYNLKVITNITHTFAGDLDITITSPAGTVVTLTTDNGAGNDNVFAGTTWDDKAGATNGPGSVTDNVFANLVVETPLAPEEPLGAFIGENPNGTWTISVGDDAGGDVGSLASWSVVIQGLPAAPTTVSGTYTNSTPVAIVDNSTVTSTIVVAGAGTQIFDVNMLTNITHTFAGDLDITITSPAGTVVTLTTDNGAGNDNVFNGTLWDDKAGATNAPGAVTDNVFANLVVETPLAPEEGLAAFIGENPNGTWTISIGDDAGGDVGSLASWSLVIATSTCGGALGPCAAGAATTYTNNTPVAIVDNTTVTSNITVAGAPTYLYNLKMITNITHTFAGDLDITITSPAGTVVTLTTDNGAGNDNVFAGTTWDDKAGTTNAPGSVTDNVFANLVVETPLAPEEPLGAFIGENPNGTWTISVGDDAGGDVGSLASWSLVIQGLSAAPTTASGTYSNNTPVNIVDNTTVTSTVVVAGAGTQILDVNMLTNITHTFAGDLDITITSPAGTVVTLTTDNGAGNDNVFAGTLWDDKAGATNAPGAVTDNVFANLVVETPLAPEEPLAAFIGENPNGTWTIAIGDDAGGDVGILNSWSLTIVTSLCGTASCTLTCPANITVTTVPGQCTRVVNYPAPTVTGGCGAVTAVPAAGFAFPIGTTTVNVSVAGGGPTCSFTVTVNDGQPPVINSHPATDTACATTTASFVVVASAASSYQWQVSTGGAFVNIPGATFPVLTLTNVLLSQHLYQYRVIVTGTCTSVTSNPATLYVNPLPTATILASPHTTLHPGQLTTIYATYNHVPVNFAWYQDSNLVQTGSSPLLANLDVDDLGSYHLVYTDNNGCIATTAPLALNADPNFQFWVYPNPNNGQFLVRFYSYTLGVKRTVRVWDAKGARVFQNEFTMNSHYQRMDINISKYSPGVYYIELLDATGKQLGTGSVVVRK